MFHLILTACLATDPGTCLALDLPHGAAPIRPACEGLAARISADWLATHPGLIGAGTVCTTDPPIAPLPVQQVAPGIYTHFGTSAEVSPVNEGRIANLSFVVGDTVAVIDAGSTRAEGQALLAAIRAVTDKPVSHLILTHMHPDHTLGASVFIEAGAHVIGHPRLADALSARADTYLDSFTRQIGARAMIGTTAPTPDRAAPEGTVIDLGSRRLTLTPVPTAHTDNDLMVRDDLSDTLFTGDLIFRGLAPVVDGALNGWLAWMDLPPQPAPARIVPGHGPLAATWEEAVADQRALLTDLRAAVRARIAQGVPMSEAVPDILAEMESHAGGWVNFDATLSRDATAAYKELEWE